jgi:hypothetical protein
MYVLRTMLSRGFGERSALAKIAIKDKNGATRNTGCVYAGTRITPVMKYPGGSKAFYWAVANVKWGLVSRSSRIAVYLIIFWPGAPIGNLSKFQNGPSSRWGFQNPCRCPMTFGSLLPPVQSFILVRIHPCSPLVGRQNSSIARRSHQPTVI